MRRARIAEEALRVRGWALGVLAGAGDAAPPAASAEGWRAFLAAEGCALPLRARLAAPLPAPAGEVLDAAAAAELRRVLSARGQLRLLGRMAERRGWRLVVLKGGAHAHDDRAAVDLVDVDVLGRAGELDELAAMLREQGYRQVSPPSSHGAGDWAAPGGIQVELHHAVPGVEPFHPVWDRIVPAGALWRLHPADHLWHLLVHAVVQHPDRRGRLRDLLLMAAALEGCDAASREEVARRIAADPYAEALRASLEIAGSLAEGTAPPADPFPTVAATRYLVMGWKRGRLPPVVATFAGVAVFARFGGHGGETGTWTHSGMGLERPSALPGFGWLHRHAPRAERAARMALRNAPLWAMAPLRWAVTARARRVVRRALRPTP